MSVANVWKAVAAATSVTFLSTIPSPAQSAADFYKGKNVALAISFTPGGGYDLYARIARAPYGQAHSGQSDDRAAEHAGRRRACASRSSSTTPRRRTG